MKSKTINYGWPGNLLLLSAMMMSSFLFFSCEPETIDVQSNEITSDLKVNVTQKADHKDLPHQEIAKLRAAVAPYHNIEKAMADGYVIEVPGYFPHMGFHYLNGELMDQEFDLEHPELLLYVPMPNGELRFVGVEYATPIEDLDNPPPAPEGFSGEEDHWHINEEASLWTLHVWVGLQNPDGIFAEVNYRIP